MNLLVYRIRKEILLGFGIIGKKKKKKRKKIDGI